MTNIIPPKSFLMIPILLFAFVLFYPNLNAGFTNWDDQIHVTENKRIQSLTWESVGELFTPNTDYMYHPVTMLSYAVDWAIGGGSSTAFHRTSLLLHLINILLVYRLIVYISGDINSALIVALLFGIHPVNVETVSWVSARKDLLYSLFFLSGMNLYFGFLEGKHRIGTIIGMGIVFILGLLSKPTMVVFPLVLFMIDWWRHRPLDRNILIEKIPFVLIAFGFGIFTMALSNSDTDVVSIMSLFKFQHQVLMVCYSIVFYFGKIIIPIDLSAIHHYPIVSSGVLPAWFYAAPIILALICTGLTLAGNRWKFLLFGAGIYIIPLLLVLQILPFNNTSLVAERYAYISSIGILFVGVIGGKHILASYADGEPFWYGASSMFLVLVTLMFTIGTIIRVSVWKDSISVFSDVIQRDQTIWIAYANRALDRIKLEQYSGAMDDANRAIVLHPNRKALYAVRGNIYFFLKDYQKAIADFDSVVFSSKAKPYELYNKGASLYYLHEYDSALAYYGKAFDADSAFARAYLGYGMILQNEKRLAIMARHYFDAAIRYDGSMWEAYYFRAAANMDLGNAGGAMTDGSMALMLNPKLLQDTMITRINTSVSKYVARASVIKTEIDKGKRLEQLYGELSRTYLMLGDSIRSMRTSVAQKFIGNRKQ
ncbi:MAG: tetratricopeptide repeat protein [Bacteriovoracaceae bacterium]|nr:tetratricopeptide repeat protein [Bacteroidota bacterium]